MAVERLSAEDRLILWPDVVWPQDVGALMLLDAPNLLDGDGSFRIEQAREEVRRRLHLLPRFRQVLHEPRRGLGGPLWTDVAAVDLRAHVNVVAVPAPGDEDQVLAVVEALRRRRLDRSRPLWEMWFVTGLSNGRIALFVRLHHVVADGIAGVTAVAAFLDSGPETVSPTPQAWAPAPRPAARELFVDNLRARWATAAHVLSSLGRPTQVAYRLRQRWPAMRELLAAEPGPTTSLGRLIGGGRSMALVRSSLVDVKTIAHANGATINDVLLSITAGGVRQLLESRGERVENLVVPVYVPVSLRSAVGDDHPVGNLITQMVVPLPVGQTDAVRRLGETSAASAKRKSVPRASLGGTFRNRPVAGVMLKHLARQRVNIVTADLPGPSMPLYFAGAQILEVFPLVNLLGTVTLGVAALSYAGTFNIMVVADADAYPDLGVLAAGLRSELQALSAAASTPVRA